MIKEYDFKKYQTPSGGCKLTDKEFSGKLKNFLEKKPDFGLTEVQLIQLGRHIWLDDQVLFVVTRNKDDADKLQELRSPEFLFVKMKDIPGPHVLVLFMMELDLDLIKRKAGEMILKFKKVELSSVEFVAEFAGNKEIFTLNTKFI